MKSIDIRSEAAVNLLAEFLDMDTGQNSQVGGSRKNAEHFAHGEFRSSLLLLFIFDIRTLPHALHIFEQLRNEDKMDDSFASSRHRLRLT